MILLSSLNLKRRSPAVQPSFRIQKSKFRLFSLGREVRTPIPTSFVRSRSWALGPFLPQTIPGLKLVPYMNTSVRVPHPNSLGIQNSAFSSPSTPGPKSLGFQLSPLGNMGSFNSKDPQISPGYRTPGLLLPSLQEPSASSSFKDPEILAIGPS